MNQKQIFSLALASTLMMFFQNCGETAMQFENVEKVSIPASIPEDTSNEVSGDPDTGYNQPPGEGDVEVEDGGIVGGGENNDSDPDAPYDPDRDGVENNYDDVAYACQNAQAYEAEVEVSFPEYAGCNYNVDGNLAPKDRYYQARVEHARYITLPEGAVLCDIDFNAGVSTMYYDDHFIFTLNNYVLGASTNEFMESNYIQVADEMENLGQVYA